MAERNEKRVTFDQLPHIKQNLKLRCCQCGKQSTYDVGAIFYESEGEGEATKHHHTFTNYFRCRNCQGPGPWEVADHIRLLGLVLRARVSKGFEGLYAGRCALFDGTFIQTPAMGEEHLRRLMEKDPRNPFLCSRLGNLLRSCHQTDRATEWYTKALRLDPNDIESRYHLYNFAVAAGKIEAALTHAPLLVRALLEGCETEKPELTEGIAFALVGDLRKSSEEFRSRILGEPRKTPREREHVFIEALFNAQGDEEAVIDHAVECLLRGEVELNTTPISDLTTADSQERPVDLIASLREIAMAKGLNSEELTVALELEEQTRINIKDRHSVPLQDDKEKTACWSAASLREMFRGKRLPPSDSDMNHYPPEYYGLFYLVEERVLRLCDAIGDRTDQQLEEIFSTLRRRPDGKSLGPAHDFLWQVAAVMLGKYALSEAEFNAIFGQLARSVRHWALRPISRNYIGYLRRTFREDDVWTNAGRISHRRPGGSQLA